MRKTRRANKHSTSIHLCKKAVTDEVIRLRRMTHKIQRRNHTLAKMKKQLTGLTL